MAKYNKLMAALSTQLAQREAETPSAVWSQPADPRTGRRNLWESVNPLSNYMPISAIFITLLRFPHHAKGPGLP